ncbi:sorting nexin-13-like [Amphibalanus amphitrite]|uniref:sorting nexin-13-like n=1 Tax=Amphibalanus amphitrite TaxID=1232801 RepID=UPI001C8FB3B9|nr:sorting nexin-13-like [Amphibalanus amphitrite]XP_043222119.1 sorting nexin-13-like [Amphibalanus amphitrite]XP_043222120.1 sorting nexin-13-like [Amphibalanus amphitrite]
MGQLSAAWGTAIAAVLIHTIGLWNLLTLLLCLVTVAVSFCLTLYWQNVRAADEYSVEICRSRLPLPQPGLPSILAQLRSPARELRLDQRYTGSSPIDEQIKQVLQYAFRDFVKPWYSTISDDPEFLYELHQLVQHLIVGLASRAKEVDWVPYLTRKLVEDVLLHLRMFRQARIKFRDQLDTNKPQDLESIFFDLEAELEKKRLCRDLVCTVDTYEKDYLRDVSRVLLHQLLPDTEFSCRVQQAAAVELLSQLALLPLAQMLSEPDFVNRTIVWLCSDVTIASDVFLTALRLSDDIGELHATRDAVNKEIALLRSRDIGGDETDEVKDQMSSMLYVRKTIDHRIHRLQEGSDTDSAGLPSQIDWNRLQAPGCKLFNLPLDVMLKNNVALSYFLEYMATIGEQHQLIFYLNVEGWRIAAEQQLSSLRPTQRRGRSADMDRLREAAQSIYEQCLSEKAQPRVRLDEAMQKRLIFSIRSEPTVCESWFDEAQQAIYGRFLEERIYPAFKKTPSYLKLLAELDLLKDPTGDDDDSQSTGSGGDTASIGSGDLAADEPGEPPPPARDLAKVWRIETDVAVSVAPRDTARSYTVYSVTVTVMGRDKHQETWTVPRRYSDFHDFHEKVVERYPSLAALPFPGKKTFNNQTQAFLERRRAGLNTFLNMMLRPDRLEDNEGLLAMAVAFLEIPQYARDRGNLEKTVDSIVTPLRSSMRSVGDAVKSAPDSLLQTVDGVVGGLSRAIRGPAGSLRQQADTQLLRDPALLDTEGDDSPLRIVLLLLEEVFDLRSRNQWLRRRMVTILRQIIKAMFGDRMSRRIVDYVAELTAPDQAAEYIKHFKNTLWPNGAAAQHQPPRDDATRMRTRIVAKTAMLSSVTDEMKHILGSETARRGVFLVFDLVQSPVLNRRLLYVLLEGVLELLLPDCDVTGLMARLHARSPRVSADIPGCQRRQPVRK